jgi:glycosyltransferase involved in cell wall biosynthesis
LHEHVAHDDLVAWAWNSGEGREPAPGTQELLGQLIQAWIDSGAECPWRSLSELSKAKFLGEAQALLFPIDWPEPFGLVMIDAMACGTPILAFRQGSVSEIIDQGVTGAIVDAMKEAAMLPKVLALDRHAVRRRFEERFPLPAWLRTVALYRSMLKRPSRPAAETTVPLLRSVLGRTSNGHGLHGDRVRHTVGQFD